MKDVNSVKGVHNTRTMSSARRRSIPQTQSSSYLELYMLEKEKERLLLERNKMSVNMGTINNRLEEIEIESQRLAKIKGLDCDFLKNELIKAKDENIVWKSVSLNY